MFPWEHSARSSGTLLAGEIVDHRESIHMARVKEIQGEPVWLTLKGNSFWRGNES
jgi:hypothetical protein